MSADNRWYYIQSLRLCPLSVWPFSYYQMNSSGIQESWKMVEILNAQKKESDLLSYFRQIHWFTPELVKAKIRLLLKGTSNITEMFYIYSKICLWWFCSVEMLIRCYFENTKFWDQLLAMTSLFSQFLEGHKEIKTILPAQARWTFLLTSNGVNTTKGCS